MLVLSAGPTRTEEQIACRDRDWAYTYRIYEQPELYDRKNDRECSPMLDERRMPRTHFSVVTPLS